MLRDSAAGQMLNDTELKVIRKRKRDGVSPVGQPAVFVLHLLLKAETQLVSRVSSVLGFLLAVFTVIIQEKFKTSRM